MTSRTATAVADGPAPATASSDWLLRVTLDRGCLISPDLPIAERGPLQAVFHGLLFDQDALASTLGLPRNSPEGELVLAACERWRDDALGKLRGCFVVAVADRSAGRAMVARDALGLHPLFYASTGHELVFASSPATLCARAGVSKRLNRAALADHLCYRWPDPQETFYESVCRVRAGSFVLAGNGRFETAKYWNPIPDDRPMDWLDEADVDQFSALLDQAVDRCLKSGRTGIFLSGGLDSISIAAVAADRARQLACSRSDRAVARVPPPGLRRAPGADRGGEGARPSPPHD